MNDEKYEEHYSMLEYFWRDKQNLESYSDWEEIKDEVKERNPGIYMLWEQRKQATKALNNILGTW